MNPREAASIECIVRNNARTIVREITDPDDDTMRKMVDAKNDDELPFVIRGYASEWPCVKKWSDMNYLRAKAQQEVDRTPDRKYGVTDVPQKGDAPGELRLTEGKHKLSRQTMSKFLNNQGAQYMLGIHCPTDNTLCPIQKTDAESETTVWRNDLPQHPGFLDWFDRAPDHNEFFMARLGKGEKAFTNLHWDGYKNIYVAVAGKRVWYICHPDQGMFMRPSSMGTNSNFVPVKPNLQQYEGLPYARYIKFERIELNAGDILCLPPKWWHLVESVPDERTRLSIAFNFFWRSSSSDHVVDPVLRDIPRGSVQECDGFRKWIHAFPRPQNDTAKQVEVARKVALAFWLIRGKDMFSAGQEFCADELDKEMLDLMISEISRHKIKVQAPLGFKMSRVRARTNAKPAKGNPNIDAASIFGSRPAAKPKARPMMEKPNNAITPGKRDVIAPQNQMNNSPSTKSIPRSLFSSKTPSQEKKAPAKVATPKNKTVSKTNVVEPQPKLISKKCETIATPARSRSSKASPTKSGEGKDTPRAGAVKTIPSKSRGRKGTPVRDSEVKSKSRAKTEKSQDQAAAKASSIQSESSSGKIAKSASSKSKGMKAPPIDTSTSPKSKPRGCKSKTPAKSKSRGDQDVTSASKKAAKTSPVKPRSSGKKTSKSSKDTKCANAKGADKRESGLASMEVDPTSTSSQTVAKAEIPEAGSKTTEQAIEPSSESVDLFGTIVPPEIFTRCESLQESCEKPVGAVHRSQKVIDSGGHSAGLLKSGVKHRLRAFKEVRSCLIGRKPPPAIDTEQLTACSSSTPMTSPPDEMGIKWSPNAWLNANQKLATPMAAPPMVDTPTSCTSTPKLLGRTVPAATVLVECGSDVEIITPTYGQCGTKRDASVKPIPEPKRAQNILGRAISAEEFNRISIIPTPSSKPAAPTARYQPVLSAKSPQKPLIASKSQSGIPARPLVGSGERKVRLDIASQNGSQPVGLAKTTEKPRSDVPKNQPSVSSKTPRKSASRPASMQPNLQKSRTAFSKKSPQKLATDPASGLIRSANFEKYQSTVSKKTPQKSTTDSASGQLRSANPPNSGASKTPQKSTSASGKSRSANLPKGQAAVAARSPSSKMLPSAIRPRSNTPKSRPTPKPASEKPLGNSPQKSERSERPKGKRKTTPRKMPLNPKRAVKKRSAKPKPAAKTARKTSKPNSKGKR